MTMLHSSVCNRGHLKFCMGSITTSILHSWPCTIRLSLVWSFEKKPVRTPLCQWESTAECYAAVAWERERERVTFTVWEYTLAQRSTMETTLKNDYAFGNDIVKFCEIFSCPMCKEHETKLGFINPLNAELNPICHLLALLGAHHILHVSRIRVNSDCLYTICLPNCILWQSVSGFYSHEVHKWWINLGLMYFNILLPFIITVYAFYIYFNILNLIEHEY